MEPSVLVLFGLDGQSTARDVEKMLLEAGAPVPQHVGLNGKHVVAFARFASSEECASAWRLARDRRLALRGRALRAECRDEALETEMRLASTRLAEAYEDPRARFVPLLLAARARPFPPLRPPGRVPERDRTEFVNAWKSLLLAEACAQVEAGEATRNARLGVAAAERLAGTRVSLTLCSAEEGEEEIMVCDAVRWRGTVGVVEESAGTRLAVQFEHAPPAGAAGETQEGELEVLASLLGCRRAYEALNWFLTADLADNPAAQSLFQGRAARFSPLAAPRAPAALNAAQGRVLTRFALLEEGAMLCQGPPGTGKTTLLAAAIEAAAAPRARVVVCAPSNKAVHEILARFRARNPLLQVLLLGNATRRPLPPEARHVYCDTMCAERADALQTAAAAGDGEGVARLCAELRRWGLPLAMEALERQAGRVRRAVCWACEKAAGCACGPWAAGTRALHEVAAALRGTDHRRGLVRGARVIFMTLAACGRAFVRETLPRLDTLLVDEAGQASEPELLLALRLGARRAMLVGDPRQLPSTVFSAAAHECGYGVSTMERLMAAGGEALLLDEQYRMPAALRQWPSDAFYDGRLTDHPSLATRPAPWPGASPLPGMLPDGCRALVRCGGTEERAARGESVCNRAEAAKAAELATQLLAATPGLSVGVVTFYAAQASLLRELLPAGCAASSVDGFQGGECDVVLLSLVRERVAASPFLNDPKRLCVALTRARHYLVVLCSDRHPPGRGLVSDFLASF
jgi:hypothetical protein